nr:calexcitin-1-like [Cherax quadricarinatus]
MSDLSAFRRAKLLHVFNTFFDVNGSGEIDEKDLEIAIQKVCGARGWGRHDPHYNKTRDALRKLWDVLTSKADTDHDKQVSVEEWYAAWRLDESAGREWSHIFRDLMFLLEDASASQTDLPAFLSFTNGSSELVKESLLEHNSQSYRSGWSHLHRSMQTTRPADKQAWIMENVAAALLASANSANERVDDAGEVTKDKFDELWEQYFHSENVEAPGNYIFGKFDF